jgi:uncharacterized protein YdeI (YjbR/CyaY-like superfamily)
VRPDARPFASARAFRAWLEKNGATATELYVRCAKVGAAGGLTYKQALDEALCLGWIDGVRHSLDAKSFSVRFTPRKPKSAWSAVNVKRFAQLEAEGRLHPAGRAAYAAGRRTQYSYESRPQELAPAYLKKFKERRTAWVFFSAQPPWYRRTCAFWVMSAKRPETRERRLDELIARSQDHEGLPALKSPRKG